MEIDIKKDKRNNGFHFHKTGGVKNVTKTKAAAMIDIMQECGDNKFYSQLYIGREEVVLTACSCKIIILEIDTTIY